MAGMNWMLAFIIVGCLQKQIFAQSIETGHESCGEQEPFTCPDGQCLPLSMVCNGIVDCDDNSDESNCTIYTTESYELSTDCGPKEFLGPNGRCLVNSTMLVPCQSHEFLCKNGICISKRWECDGHKDCRDGSDEGEHCFQRPCPNHQHTCENKKCLHASLLCNGVDDCGDNSDEKYCVKQHICHWTRERCFGTLKCIMPRQFCDGVQDCPNNEDEFDCIKCKGPDAFRCSNSKCISTESLCNRVDDCGDMSDEKDCPGEENDKHRRMSNVQCEYYYKCQNGLCVDFKDVCNDKNDCYDNSDEGGLCQKSCLPNEKNLCQQICRETPEGPSCACFKGFVLAEDNSTCRDINECDANSCSQICQNTISSFQCSCFENYSLASDKITCKYNGKKPMELITATKDDIRKITGNYSIIELIHEERMSQISGLDVHVEKELLYWSDEFLGTIHKWNLKTREYNISRIIGRPKNIAVDWISDNIYVYEDIALPSIKVCDLNVKQCGVLINIFGDKKVMALAVYPENGWLFWSQVSFFPEGDKDVTSEIIRTNINGRKITVIADKGLGIVSGITIDHLRSQLYWVDSDRELIERSRFDGSEREIFMREKVSSAIGINIFEDSIYWLISGSGSLRKCLLYAENECEIIKLGSANMQDLFVIADESRQPISIGTHPRFNVAIKDLPSSRNQYSCPDRPVFTTACFVLLLIFSLLLILIIFYFMQNKRSMVTEIGLQSINFPYRPHENVEDHQLPATEFGNRENRNAANA